jgi:hypothetical protein
MQCYGMRGEERRDECRDGKTMLMAIKNVALV